MPASRDCLRAAEVPIVPTLVSWNHLEYVSVSESGECHVDSYEFPQVMVSTYSERGVALFNSVYLLLLILFLKQRQYQWMGEKKE